MTPEFRVRAATRIVATGFLAIDELEVASGDETFRRLVVRHPGAVVVVPVDANGDARCIRQWRAATGGTVLEVPAGKRDVVGEAPVRTAARELEEEIGVRAGRFVKLAEFWNTPGFCDEYSHLYVALDLEPAHAPAPTSPEERALVVEHVALGAVERLVATRELVDAKSIIGLLLARAYLAGTHPGIDEA